MNYTDGTVFAQLTFMARIKILQVYSSIPGWTNIYVPNRKVVPSESPLLRWPYILNT